MSCLILMLHFRIGNRSLAHRTPVDDSGAFIDIAFFIQFHKYFFYRFRTAFIHGKTFPLPVCGGAHLLQLAHNTVSIFLLPLPAMLQKFLASNLILINAFFLQHLDNLHLSGNCRMVCTRLPQRLIALHSLKTNQNILHRIIQCMPHMKLSRNIRRRHHNGKRFLLRIYFGMKISLVQPLLIQSVFQTFGIIGLCKFFAHLLPLLRL